MALQILDATTRAAVASATSQQSKCEALIAAWAGGNATARLFAPDGTTLLRTLTLPPLTINSATPRSVVCGAYLADTHIATGTPGRWVFRSGSTDIFSIDAGTSGASVNHVGSVKALCTPTIAGVLFTADASLPLVSAPAWMEAALLNRYNVIPGTAGSGGSSMNVWGTIVVGEDLKVRSNAPGGHGDSFDNRSVEANLGLNTPGSWVVTNPTSLSVPPPFNPLDGAQDPAYYYDNAEQTLNPKPGSRHHYAYMYLDERTGVRRVILLGYLGTYPNGGSKNTIDGFDIDSKVWDTPGSWPLTGTSTAVNGVNGQVYGACQHKPSGHIYWKADGRLWRLDPATRVRTEIASQFTEVGGFEFAGWGVLGRFPIAHDTLRDAFFSLQWGNAQTGGTGLLAGQLLNPTSGSPTPRTITFNPSAALTQLTADRPWYAAMEYDVLRDRFVFTGGVGDAVGVTVTTDWTRVYEIIPNSSAVWDVQLATVASTAVVPGNIPGAGLNSRFRYVQRGSYGGFLILANQADPLHFYRTS